MTRPGYQLRVIDELRDLSAKIDLLDSFLSSPMDGVSAEAAHLLRQQRFAMGVYASTLRDRIGLFDFEARLKEAKHG